MPTLVVPFRGAEGKSRLELPTTAARTALVRAMLADVLAACAAVGTTFVVTPEETALDGASLILDPMRGQGAAVRTGLDAAIAAGGTLPVLVVNADLPCVTPRDLLTLAGSVPGGGLAPLPPPTARPTRSPSRRPTLAPVFGPGSAARFAALAPSLVVDSPNLRDDVDTVTDLERLETRLGPRTRKVLAALRAGTAA